MESTKGKKNRQSTNTGLKLLEVSALTPNQGLFFKNYNKHQVISLTGYAGTGKTFIALHQALRSLGDVYKKVLIIRSAVSSRDMGFLPGSKKEKMEVYEGPYISNCKKLYGRGDAYQILKQKGLIEFESSSFLRGETFEEQVVIIDEAQNMSYQELYTILTRIGDNCKVVICGDVRQDDLTNERYKEVSGYAKILKTLELIPDCFSVMFDEDDIVRSGFVKSLILVTANQK